MLRRIKECWNDPQTRSLSLVILASVLERADVAAVPAVFRELGRTFNVSPMALGCFKLVQMTTQAMVSPLAAYLALRYRRTAVIAAGAGVSAIATFGIAVSATLPQIVLCIALNSIGVAVTLPAILSLVADATDESNRGTTFGCLHLTGHVGAFVGGVSAVLFAGTSAMGVSGWRLAFLAMSVMSFLVAASLRLFASDPHQISDCDNAPLKTTPIRAAGLETGFETSDPHQDNSRNHLLDATSRRTVGLEAKTETKFGASPLQDFRAMVQDAGSVLRVHTFKVILLQSLVASIAWSALSFSSMWLELTGFTHGQTATMCGIFTMAGSVGGLFGGFMGDQMCTRYPIAGRIILGQFSTGIAVPLTTILLRVLPLAPPSAVLYGVVFFAMGSCMTWTAPATFYPIMAEIVPSKSRTNVYALEKAFISLFGALSPPLVGLMSEKIFGFVPVPAGMVGNVAGRLEKSNAAALGKAMSAATGLPFLACCLLFVPLYWAYPRDRDMARYVQAAWEQGNLSTVMNCDEKGNEEMEKWNAPWMGGGNEQYESCTGAKDVECFGESDSTTVHSSGQYRGPSVRINHENPHCSV